MRWNGFVDSADAGGAGGGGAGASGAAADGAEASGACVIILKKGFLLSVSVGGLTTVVGGDTTGAVGAAGGVDCRSSS